MEGERTNHSASATARAGWECQLMVTALEDGEPNQSFHGPEWKRYFSKNESWKKVVLYSGQYGKDTHMTVRCSYSELGCEHQAEDADVAAEDDGAAQTEVQWRIVGSEQWGCGSCNTEQRQREHAERQRETADLRPPGDLWPPDAPRHETAQTLQDTTCRFTWDFTFQNKSLFI